MPEMPGLWRRRLPALVLCGSLLLLLMVLTACDRVTGVSGKVQDAEGAPLAGVTVTLETEGRAPHPTTSAADGSFEVTIVGAEPGKTTLTLEKAGYQTVRRPLTQDRESALVVTLPRLAAAPPPQP
jgi:hypothetical protein